MVSELWGDYWCWCFWIIFNLLLFVDVGDLEAVRVLFVAVLALDVEDVDFGDFAELAELAWAVFVGISGSLMRTIMLTLLWVSIKLFKYNNIYQSF
jgi:hypothetical protein